MYNYLQVGFETVTPTGAVIGAMQGDVPLPSYLADYGCFLEIPDDDPNVYRGYHYLGVLALGVTVLGDNFETLLEAPPAPGCYWNGEEWICPVEGAVAE